MTLSTEAQQIEAVTAGAVSYRTAHEDSAKQMHLVFTLVLAFWTLLALLGTARAIAWRNRARAEGNG